MSVVRLYRSALGGLAILAGIGVASPTSWQVTDASQLSSSHGRRRVGSPAGIQSNADEPWPPGAERAFRKTDLGPILSDSFPLFPIAPVPGYRVMGRRVPTEQLAMTEPWSSVDKVAKHLGVAQDSIYRWIESRGLPAHKIGRLWKFKLSEVDEWVRVGGAEGGEKAATKKSPKARRGRS